jgi:NAD dependent epimerase/dehydratase
MDLKGRTVLVTGADGFIGSHLVEALIEQGCIVKAFCFYNSFNSLGWLDTLPKERLKQFEVIMGDVRDPGVIRNAMKKVNIAFHLAALIGIPYSYHAPDNYIETNIKGTLNILQASRDADVEKILVTSTSEVYGTAVQIPIDEKHPRQGQSPYSATKIGADSIAESFYRSFNMPVTIVRPFNTYGPRQSARAIIPTIITQLMSGKKEIKLGALHPTRDLLFVKDTVSGFICIAQSDKVTGEEINIATQTEISMMDLANRLISMISPSASIATDKERLRPDKSEVERLLGSNEKIRRLTKWKPEYSLEQGLKQTIEWFSEKNNLDRYKPDIYNL